MWLHGVEAEEGGGGCMNDEENSFFIYLLSVAMFISWPPGRAQEVSQSLAGQGGAVRKTAARTQPRITAD